MKIKTSAAAVSTVVALLLAFSGTALATGSASVSSGTATFTAGAGDWNDLTISYSASAYVFSDNGTAITAGTGCTQTSSNVVTCGSASNVAAYLGDSSDNGTIDSSVPTTGTRLINGGDDSDVLTGAGGADTLQAGDDTAFAGSYNFIYGNGGDDTLTGDADASQTSFDGGAGADLMTGYGSDIIDYSSRSGNVTVTYDANYNDGESGEGDKVAGSPQVLLLGSGNDTATGSNGFSYIVGGAGDDTIDAGGGNDAVYGEGGNDTLTGGSGVDYLTGEDGDDTLYGGAGNDDLYGGEDSDTIYGDADNDTIYGGGETGGSSAMNYLYGGTGNDQMTGDGDALQNYFDGGTGADRMSGGGGDVVDYSSRSAAVSITVDATANDGESGEADKVTGMAVYYLGSAGDTFTGAGNTEVVYGYDGADTIDGAGGADNVLGGDGNDSLTGGSGGGDYVQGEGDNDTIHIDDGNTTDAATCGSGTDTADADTGESVNGDCESVTYH